MEQFEDCEGPVYGEELEAVMDDIKEGCDAYKLEHLADAETVREDFGVGLYWDYEDEERFVLVTAYNQDRAYLSAGVSMRDNSEEIVELGFVDLEGLKIHLEVAGARAESIQTPL